MTTAEKNIIQGKYKLCGILGKGHFGTVCKGMILKTKMWNVKKCGTNILVRVIIRCKF